MPGFGAIKLLNINLQAVDYPGTLYKVTNSLSHRGYHWPGPNTQCALSGVSHRCGNESIRHRLAVFSACIDSKSTVHALTRLA